MLIAQWLVQRQCPSKNSSCSSAHSLINKYLTPERLKIIGLGKHRSSNGEGGAHRPPRLPDYQGRPQEEPGDCLPHLSAGGQHPHSGQRSPSRRGPCSGGSPASPCSCTHAIPEEGRNRGNRTARAQSSAHTCLRSELLTFCPASPTPASGLQAWSAVLGRPPATDRGQAPQNHLSRS